MKTTVNSDAETQPASDVRAHRPRARGLLRLRELTTLISIVLCATVFGILTPKLIGFEPAMVILEGTATDGLMVLGMTLVIVCGGFDLSIGSTMAAGGLVVALLLKAGVPVPLAVALGLLLGVIVGLTNGFIVTRLKINPFITTLGTMTVIRGVVLVVTKSMPPTGFPQSFLDIAWGRVLGIPNPVIIMVIALVIADLLMRHLSYLRRAYFVGSNEEAARLCGINTGAVKTLAFALTGMLSALAGVIVASRANAVDPNEGLGAELRVIAAVIVGGASLSGGRGTMLGSFLGLLLMQIISTGLVFVNVAPEAQLIAVGLVLIVAGVIDRFGSTLGQVLSGFFAARKGEQLK